MKKKLEADLISIAHRILQLKNKSDINQLYLETQKLYEKLTVLQFVENHFSEVKPTIGLSEVTQQLETIFEEKATAIETNVEEEIPTTQESEIEKTIEETVKEESSIVEPEAESEPQLIPEAESNINNEEEGTEVNESISYDEVEEDTKEEVAAVTDNKTAVELEPQHESAEPELAATAAFAPAFSLLADEVEETPVETTKKPEAVQISFEDLLGGNYHDTLFVKKQQIENIPTAVVIETPEEIALPQQPELVEAATEIEKTEAKAVSLNDKLAKGIHIDLNDRLAFIKHLFANSSEDYNRVLSQINTFNSFYETRDFVQDMVKPDYNNWEGKQEYEDRFMDIIEKKFL
ncbi:hypothetical protein KBJ98_01925 [Flavobacterium sp. F-328]|uniref:DUF4476 domain-containing protein n=1 Tax=Flavobacterium erciyesense TaxID=2825842 RepID=A0ABS5D0A7_9FLAO|nr:hypothetical protein [Flavobacterium erciyesense]MBQ0907454.1 hypothetical protein [Flavobacterium erciyesense]